MSETTSSADQTPEAKLASLIIENAREYAIFTIDLEGAIMSWSTGAEQILGYTADEAIGMPFSALFLPVDVTANAPEMELEKAARDGRAENSRWHNRKNGERFWANGVTMALEDASPPALLKIMRDETPMKMAEDQRVLLLNELNHRIKNTLATVQSIAEQTLRSADVDPATRHTLTDRLIALSDAHNVLVKENWAGADLHTIVKQALSPYGHDTPNRFLIDGPILRLSPHQAVAMALALHELSTNATKYGALKVEGGKVSVTWNLAQDGLGGRHMTFLWKETGGPKVEQPTRTGFGTRLIARTFGRESGGKARIEYLGEGACCVIELPLSDRSEIPALDLKGNGAGSEPPARPEEP